MHNITEDWRIILRNKPAWHRLGIIIKEDDELELVDAVKTVAGDVEFARAQHCFLIDKDDIGEGKRRLYHVRGQQDVFRLPTDDNPYPVYIGSATEHWQLNQYHEYADTLNDLSKKHRIETCGLLGKHGETLFFALRYNEFDVKGSGGSVTDPIKNYLVFQIPQTPGQGNVVMLTPVRVVCQNTLTMALGSALNKFSIPHRGDASVTSRTRMAADLIGRMDEAQEEAQEIFQAMVDTPTTGLDADSVVLPRGAEPPAVTDDVVEMLINSVYSIRVPMRLQMLRRKASMGGDGAPMLTDSEAVEFERREYQQMLYEERIRKVQQTVRSAYGDFNSKHPKMARTAWAIYNAFTDSADWRKGRGNTAESALFGQRASEKRRAFQNIVGLMQN